METIQQPMNESKKIYPWKEYSKKYDKKKKEERIRQFVEQSTKEEIIDKLMSIRCGI